MDFWCLKRFTQMSAGMMMQALMELELSWGIENREGLLWALLDFIVLKPMWLIKRDAKQAPSFLFFLG